MFSASWQCIIEAGGEVQVSCGSIQGQNEEIMFYQGKAGAVMCALHH